MRWQDYWKHQHCAQTKQRKIEQYEEFERLLLDEIEAQAARDERLHQIEDVLAGLAVDVRLGREPNLEPILRFARP
jgi:hypothetical protein